MIGLFSCMELIGKPGLGRTQLVGAGKVSVHDSESDRDRAGWNVISFSRPHPLDTGKHTDKFGTVVSRRNALATGLGEPVVLRLL